MTPLHLVSDPCVSAEQWPLIILKLSVTTVNFSQSCLQTKSDPNFVWLFAVKSYHYQLISNLSIHQNHPKNQNRNNFAASPPTKILGLLVHWGSYQSRSIIWKYLFLILKLNLQKKTLRWRKLKYWQIKTPWKILMVLFSSRRALQPHLRTYQSQGPTCHQFAVKRHPQSLHHCPQGYTPPSLTPVPDYPPVCQMGLTKLQPSFRAWIPPTWQLFLLDIQDLEGVWWVLELPCQVFHTLLVNRTHTLPYPWKIFTILW